MGYTIDIDTGGTFTDGFFTDGTRFETVKVETTMHDLTVCFADCIAAGARRLGLEVGGLLSEATVVRFSTTVGTNTLIQGTGPKLGLLVSRGQERSSDRRLDELAPPELVQGLQQPLDAEAVRTAVKELLNLGARAIVVSLDNSYLNPADEQQIKDIILDDYPKHYLGAVRVFLASELCSRPGTARRTHTTVLNAYLHPELVRCLYRADDHCRRNGLRSPLLVGHATGGVARVAKTKAIDTYNSGPVAGLMGARRMAKLYGLEHVVTVDVGGTSADISVLRGGESRLSPDPVIHGLPVEAPIYHVLGIGIGGGSIARVTGGSLRVGPQSAGASPGPVCFALGGTEPTPTDALTATGFIDPGYFLGGSRRLDRDGATATIRERIATPLGVSVADAAWAIKEQAEATVAAAIRQELDIAGVLPERVALFSYGGAGGLFAAGVADKLGIPTVYTFVCSPVFSAFGSSTMDVVHLYTHAVCGGEDPTPVWELLKRRALRDMRGEGFPPEAVRFAASDEQLNDGRLLLELKAAATVPHFTPGQRPVGGSDPGGAAKGLRPIYWAGAWHDTPVYDHGRLQPGNRVAGPAVIEAADTTYAVPDGFAYVVDRYGNGLIGRGSVV